MFSCCNHKPTDLTPNDVANILNKNYTTILRWVKEGRFKNAHRCKHCDAYLVPSSDVEDYIESLKKSKWVGIYGEEKNSKNKNNGSARRTKKKGNS